MATKRKKGDIDLIANLRSLLSEVDPQGKLMIERMKEMLAKPEPDDLVAALSPEEREVLMQRLQNAGTPKRHAAGS